MAELVSTAAELDERVRRLHRLQTHSPDIEMLKACDILPAIKKTEVWVGAQDSSEPFGWVVAEAKIAIHRVEPESYPVERDTMVEIGSGTRLIRHWCRLLPPGHDAYKAVEALAAAIGTMTRKSYRVYALDPALVEAGTLSSLEVAAQDASPDPEDAIVQAIGKLMPLLGAEGRGRVRTLAAR